MGKLDFAIGEIKCGRLPWVSGWVWTIVLGLLAGIGIGYYAAIWSIRI